MKTPERRRKTPYEAHELRDLATKTVTQSYLVVALGLVLPFLAELAFRQAPDFADDTLQDAALRYLGGAALALVAAAVGRATLTWNRHPFVEGSVLMVSITAILACSAHHTGGAQGPFSVGFVTLLFCWSLIMPGGARYAAFPLFGGLATFYGVLFVAGGRGFFDVRTTAVALFTTTSACFALVYAEVLERWRRRVSLAVSTDGLTQLSSRRDILHQLDRLLARGQARREPLSVLMVDVDFFKRVNDTYGHDVGDAVLRGVANQLVASTREQDACGRLGGEEFLLVLEDCDGVTALEVAERVRANVGAERFESEGEAFGVTVSIGVSTVEGGSTTLREAVVRAADVALYTSKTQGRDRVTVAV